MRTVHNVVQGSPAWLALRSSHDCASEAPVMLGHSKKCSRSELLRMKADGDEREFSDWVVKNLLERGHAVEAFARARIEARLGEELYPATITFNGMLASLDGVTMDGETGFECKLWNEELAAAARRGEVPDYHWPQLEQQIEVAGLKRVIFVVTDGTADRFVHLTYMAVPGRINEVRAGWKQFHEDVASYKHVEVIPKAVAESLPSLPALSIQAQGEVALISNLDVFGVRLREFIKALPAKPATDQDFANCEQAVKTLQLAQERLEEAEGSALARFATIDDMRSTVAGLKALARDQRLFLEKLVKARKEEIRDEIRRDAASAFTAHVESLNARLGRPFMPRIEAKFADVMKGKKTIESLRDAVNTELARLKIESNAIADRIQVNLRLLDASLEHRFLFADERELVLKECDHFALVVSTRIQNHKAEQERKAEADRERIRVEEEAKARAKAQAETPAAAAPVPIPHVAPAITPLSRAQSRAGRPSDEDIVAAVAERFVVSHAVAIAWLAEMDLTTLTQRRATIAS